MNKLFIFLLQLDEMVAEAGSQQTATEKVDLIDERLERLPRTLNDYQLIPVIFTARQ